jgi:hypothetical protein
VSGQPCTKTVLWNQSYCATHASDRYHLKMKECEYRDVETGQRCRQQGVLGQCMCSDHLPLWIGGTVLLKSLRLWEIGWVLWCITGLVTLLVLSVQSGIQETAIAATDKRREIGYVLVAWTSGLLLGFLPLWYMTTAHGYRWLYQR